MFLEALGRRSSRFGYPCNEMRRLLLCRLPKFSISSLKEMIEERNALEVDYDDPDWKTATQFGPAISHLAVVQCGLGNLSAQDENWFRAHLVDFHWSSCFFSFPYLCHSSHMKYGSLRYWRVLSRWSPQPSVFVLDAHPVCNGLQRALFLFKQWPLPPFTYEIYPTLSTYTIIVTTLLHVLILLSSRFLTF